MQYNYGVIHLHQGNKFFVVLHKTTNGQLKNSLWQLSRHCYCGILASIITIPTVLLYRSYHNQGIASEFFPVTVVTGVITAFPMTVS